MIRLVRAWFGFFVLGLGGGGGSSQTTQQQLTQNSDMRVVGGNSSTNVSAQNSTVTVTDAGAVHQAFGFASSVTSGALDAIKANDAATQRQVSDALGQVASAWSDAKQGEQKILVGMGMIVVALVGVAALKKG